MPYFSITSLRLKTVFLESSNFLTIFQSLRRFLHILIEANEHFWSKLLKNLPFWGKNWPKIPKKSQNWPSKNVRYIYSCLMSKNPDLANFLLHKKSVSTKKFVKSVFYVIFTVVKSVDYCTEPPSSAEPYPNQNSSVVH